MSVAVLGRALLPGASAWRRAIVTVVAAAAILVGLLAMHSLNVHHGHDSSPMVTSIPVHHAAEAPAQGSVATDADCAGPCDTGDEAVSVFACILALLSTAILLVASLSTIRWHVPATWAAALARATAPAPPRPPSLHVLSISRT